jgi:hypothetical protein
MALALGAPFARPATASEITLTTANDILSGNRFSDDRYTAALAVGFSFERFELRFAENLFTDRTHGLRFDETWLTARFEPRVESAWRPTFEVGLVQVGRGLLGADAQNALHDLIGGEEVDLPYVESDTVHLVGRFELRRTVLSLERLELEAGFGGSWSPAFRSTLSASVSAAVPVTRWLTVILGVGGRLDRTELDALEPWQHDTARTGELGFVLLDRVELAWTYNKYGTGGRHVELSYRLPAGARRQAQRERSRIARIGPYSK